MISTPCLMVSNVKGVRGVDTLENTHEYELHENSKELQPRPAHSNSSNKIETFKCTAWRHKKHEENN